MPDERSVDTVVVGGGQAGLATGHHLARCGREFVILDANPSTGQSWRDRWDSLRLFTPAGYSHLPGMAFPTPTGSFPSKDDTADYIVAYADRFGLPIRHGVRIERLARDGDHYLLTAGVQSWRARHVVIATGAHTIPHIPSFAAQLDSSVAQLHSLHYRNPAQVGDGPVLVVGAGNSGAKIAVEIAASGHTVWLAGRDVGHIPTLGNPIYRLMQSITVDTAVRRRAVGYARAVGGDPLDRITRRQLRAAALHRTARVAGTRNGLPELADGQVLAPATVVWATGLRPDNAWIELPVLDAAGRVRHDRGVTDRSGVFVVGQPFQSSLVSHLVGGVGIDAARIVEQISATRRGTTGPRRRPWPGGPRSGV